MQSPHSSPPSHSSLSNHQHTQEEITAIHHTIAQLSNTLRGYQEQLMGMGYVNNSTDTSMQITQVMHQRAQLQAIGKTRFEQLNKELYEIEQKLILADIEKKNQLQKKDELQSQIQCQEAVIDDKQRKRDQMKKELQERKSRNSSLQRQIEALQKEKEEEAKSRQITQLLQDLDQLSIRNSGSWQREYDRVTKQLVVLQRETCSDISEVKKLREDASKLVSDLAASQQKLSNKIVNFTAASFAYKGNIKNNICDTEYAMKIYLENLLQSVNDVVECPLCMTCASRQMMNTCKNCGISVCSSCGKANIHFDLMDTAKWPIKCFNCKNTFDEEYILLVGGHFTAAEYARIDNHTLSLTSFFKQKVLCPCGVPYEAEGAAPRQSCAYCKKEFCSKCGTKWHTNETCEAYKKRLDDEHKALVAQLRKDFKIVNCPECKEGIEKTKLCNHMTCRCGAEFCYLCEERFEKKHEPTIPCKKDCKCYQSHKWGTTHPYFTPGDLGLAE